MWTRKGLKEKGKKAFKKSYWKCVGAGLLLSIVMGGLSIAGSSRSDYEDMTNTAETWMEEGSLIGEVSEEVNDEVNNKDDEGLIVSIENKLDSLDSDLSEAAEVVSNLDNINDNIEPENRTAFWVAFAVAVTIITAVIVSISLVISAFVAEPFHIGCVSFFYKNLHEDVAFKEVLSGFSEGYVNRAKTMLFVNLKAGLWTLLFVIPGIIKRYEYRMIPYLMAVNPNMSTKEAFAKSKEMMNGQKWKTFVYDLSFIGWGILSTITFGLAGVFYVSPYKYQSDAALFEALYGGTDDADDNFESYVEV